jgi:hypothetical protein
MMLQKKKNRSFERVLEAIFNETNMAEPTKEHPVPLQLKPFVDRLGKTDFSPLLKGKEVYLQWMSGGKNQSRGNMQIFFELTEDTYNKYIDGAITELAHPVIANAPSYEKLSEFLKSKIGDKPFYIASYYSFEEKSFVVDQYMGTDLEQDLKPNIGEDIVKGNFFIQTKSPNSPDAKKFGKIRDDDMYVYEYNADKSIKSVRFRNVELDGEFDYASKIR